jgi:hypothetical protein
MTSSRNELLQLIDLQVENRLTDSEQQRLGKLLKADPQLVTLYTEYICLHGQLHWDAGLCAAPIIPAAEDAATVETTLVSNTQNTSTLLNRNDSRNAPRRLLALAASIVAILGGWFAVSQPNKPGENTTHTTPDDPGSVQPSVVANDNGFTDELKPLELRSSSPKNTPTAEAPVADVKPALPMLPTKFEDDVVVARIDELLDAAWQEQGVVASPPASDTEWVRRVYLTLLGRVPTLNETQGFLVSDSPRKRGALIADMAVNPERASHLAVVWANLLVGRTERSGVNRESLLGFLAEQFKSNKPWIDTVDQLITATGRNDQNGATNFLLAHLNNEATPATAVTARLFLGEQISCVQCHDHPFDKGIRQQEYWALNAFFKDTERRTVALTDSGMGPKTKDIPWQLTDRPQQDRMTYFETRNGLKKATLPAYGGHEIAPGNDGNRRKELVKLLATDSESKVARAMVNRMWDHLFGYGFTTPIDDMGPHAVVSHPELLNLLTEAFVKSGYDLQRLTKWIAASRAWQSSSETIADNAVDNPESGTTPLFSRVYVRRMTPEQVYRSIRIAIRSVGNQPVEESEMNSQHRRDWVGQFAQAYGTDENDESLDFEGTIAQAMVMMNGEEVDIAIHQATEAIRLGTAKPVKSPTDALNRVALAMLTREPTPREEAAFRNRYRSLSQQNPNGAPMAAAVEDMMWAYLNSSEFVLVH